MSRSPVSVSAVLPAFNEAATLEATVTATRKHLSSLEQVDTFELIIAEDGSTDETPTVAARLAETHPEVHHLHSETRLGRGRAIERALSAATGDVFLYFDTDLATDLDALEPLIEAIATGEAAVATGSRRLADSDAQRITARAIPSAVYNQLVRWLLGSRVHDHQCGFKAFDRTVLEELVVDIDAEHWFWDTEVLVRAQAAGYQVIELPVRWVERGDSKVNVLRDAINMGSNLLGLWWRMRVRTPLRRYRAPIALLVTIILGYPLLEFAADPGEIIDAIAQVNPIWLAAAGLVYLCSWPIRGLRYRDILQQLGYTERVGFLTGAVFVSQMGNLLVPARAGDAVRAYVMKVRRDVSYPSGFASLAIERIFDLLTITLLAAGVVVGVIFAGGLDSLTALMEDPDVSGGRVALSLALGVGVIALFGYAILLGSARFDDGRFTRFLPTGDSRSTRTIRLLVSFLQDVRMVSTRPRAVLTIGASSLAIWLIDILTGALVLIAFGVNLEVTALLVISFLAVCVGNLAKIVPISPGGIGPYEAAFAIVVVSLSPIGVSVAVGAAIVDHALKNLITAAGGVISTGILNISLVTAVEEGRTGAQRRDRSVPDSPSSE